ncbi:hypothetical protein BDA99DRAFT_434384 [Phascolomyces articulosus]|uniref:SEC7 domain-containing protein n=1 Tax=Phascolomyces articulosus TaxID=60185 RepID=A0AAD5KHB7_9FUNG|nr:hypothetical protein BDA99DRAFT_434384 [Phascolomyces articulosus]
MDSSSNSPLNRPHPLAHLRNNNNNNNNGRKDSIVSENKNVQAAFDQLTKRQTLLDTPITSEEHEEFNNSQSSTGGASNTSSFTQRRLERGGAVPSSFTSFDWESRPHSSSVSSSEFDSSAYYGLSPFVTSSFMDTTTPILERGSSIGNNTMRYRSLWQRYERERRDNKTRDQSSSPEEMVMKMSPHQVPEASSPKLLQQQQQQQQQRKEQQRRQRGDDNSDIELSDEEQKKHDEHVFDVHDPASYDDMENEPPPLRPSFDKLKNMLTSYVPSSPTSEENEDLEQQVEKKNRASLHQHFHKLNQQHQTKPRLEQPPPRRHVLQTPVFQVVNANTVKGRYLFLFNDLLIICKPIMDENIIVGDQHNSGGKEARYRFRPNENSLFQVKNIVELSKLTLYLSRDDQQKPITASSGNGIVGAGTAAPRKMHPLLASALRKFETNPDASIAYLVEKQVLANEPLSIANFLFKTPDLCRRQLGYFLADPKNSDIYDAFLDCFRMVALRLDEALRILLMTLRLPSNWESLEYIIERFSKKWHDANQNVVKFHEDMVVKVVVAMLFLNAEWWYDASSEQDVFWSAREHKERRDRQRLTRRASMVDRKDERGSVAIEPLHYISALRAQKGNERPTFDEFLQRWRYYDQYILVAVEFLRDMYNSIANERLETGWDNDGEKITDAPEQDTIITVTPYRFPTRLTKSVPSAPISISIAAPDRGLQIKLRGQDLECHPNVLDFSESCVQTFTITGHTLGRTSLMFIKSGPHASRYVSPTLPRTKSIVVERPFMRYTFQIAFSHVDMRMSTAATGTNGGDTTTPTTVKDDDKSTATVLPISTTPTTAKSTTGADDQEPESPVMVRRKYIFSVETEQERTEWINWLKILSGHVHFNGMPSLVTNKNQEDDSLMTTSEGRVGLQVLKEILLADEYKKGTANITALHHPYHHLHHHQPSAGRHSLIDVASTTGSIGPASTGSPVKDVKDGDHLWVQSPGNDKDDMVVFGVTEEEHQEKKANRASSVVSKKKPNVVTKRGHEIIKLVVQNSLVPLMLGFLRKQIPSSQ